MDALTAIAQRRSVKAYDASAVMPEADFVKLMEHAILAPTSFNTQNWRFVRVTDKTLRGQVCEAAWGQSQITDACELIIICADLMAWSKAPERYWANAEHDVQSVLLPMIHNFYDNKPETQRDEAMRSAGLVAQTIMIAAKAMGYDTCPMIGFDPAAVARLIRLPHDHVICMMVAIGKAARPANPRGGQLTLREVMVENGFCKDPLL